MAKVKQKAARNGANGASTRGAQVAKQRKQKVHVQGDPKEKQVSTTVSHERAARAFIDALPSALVSQLPSAIANYLPKGVVSQGLQCSEPDIRKVAFSEQPPTGYTFIAAGNPELTNALKEFATRGGHKIFVVTVTPHAQRHELSRQIHRVGYHFPTHVVDEVCAHYGIRLNSKGELIDEAKDDDLFKRVYQTSDGQRPDEEKDQVTINTEAKQTIKDLFPKIPDNDLFKIIKHAFQLSDGRVGTAPGLTLIRRAHLSVVAHIRHVYTAYDKLLRRMAYNEARHEVEKETLAKIIEWRGGEDMSLDQTDHAAVDFLKDVIVISDGEESEGDINVAQALRREQIQVEELPSTSRARGHGRSLSPLGDAQPYQPHPRLVRTYRPSDAEIAQRTQTRYAVWDQARQDYRSRAVQNPTPMVERSYESDPPHSNRVLVPLDQPDTRYRNNPPPQQSTRVDYKPPPPHQSTPPKYIRDANGNLFERVDTQRREVQVVDPPRYLPDPVSVPSGNLVRTRPSSPQYLVRPEPRFHGPYDGGDGTIVPSIEDPDDSYMPPRAHRNPFDRAPEYRETNIGRRDDHHPHEIAYIDLTNTPSQTSKRRRLEEAAPALEGGLIRHQSPSRSQPQSAATHMGSRQVAYGEPRYSPGLQPARFVRNPFNDRQPLHDSHDHIRSAASAYQPTASQGIPERAAVQPSYRPLNYEAVLRNDMEVGPSTGGMRNAPVVSGSRSYEPMADVRAFAGMSERTYAMPAREQYIQPPAQEARVQYVYADDIAGREPLRNMPQQQVVDYDRAAPQVRTYAR